MIAKVSKQDGSLKGVISLSNKKLCGRLGTSLPDGGYDRGYSEGYSKGHEEGYAAGYEYGSKNSGDDSIADAIINRTITEIKSDAPIVGDHVFYTCKELVSAEFPNATKINANALRDCIRLVSVSIPNAEDLMGSSFRGDQNLTKLDLPKVEKLYTNVFTGCTRLKTIIFRANKVCSMSNVNILSDTPIADGTGYVYVPSALVDGYKNATNWSNYASQIRAIEDYPEICGG